MLKASSEKLYSQERKHAGTQSGKGKKITTTSLGALSNNVRKVVVCISDLITLSEPDNCLRLCLDLLDLTCLLLL